MHPVERYRALVAGGKLTGDPAQERVAAALETLAEALQKLAGTKKSLFGFSKPTVPPKGLYIHGPVGRGKSMLMDLFYDQLKIERKRRVHFHAFMLDVHARMREVRKTEIGRAHV